MIALIICNFLLKSIDKYYEYLGVILAVEHVVNQLKEMSKQVTTPEEIAQVSDLNKAGILCVIMEILQL